MRTTDLANKSETFRTFVQFGSPRVIATFVGAAAAVRIWYWSWGWGDLIVAATTLVLVGVFEWVVHLFLLHAPEDSFRMTKLRTGTGHRAHHKDPTGMVHLLLNTNESGLFAAMFGVFTALWVPAFMWLLGFQMLGPYLTGYMLALIGLLHYEWTHLLVHTRYHPKTKYYKRLARNHRLHHFRNEHNWLGVTSNVGDRLLRTYPKHKTDVPLSETARTLS
jgi:hypothetical protein